MLSVEAYEKSVQDLELLKLLAQGEREIKEGDGHTLNEVLKEADKLLAEE
jgi:hypothetical protein